LRRNAKNIAGDFDANAKKSRRCGRGLGNLKKVVDTLQCKTGLPSNLHKLAIVSPSPLRVLRLMLARQSNPWGWL
jgi:hypothetical protein